jgi:hypothetical protein
VFTTVLRYTLKASESIQVSYSSDEWGNITRRTPDDFVTTFHPNLPAYHLSKDKKQWKRAKCASCKADLPKKGSRVWTNSAFFHPTLKKFVSESTTPYFCFNRNCFEEFNPKRNIVAPPFLNNVLAQDEEYVLTDEEIHMVDVNHITLFTES